MRTAPMPSWLGGAEVPLCGWVMAKTMKLHQAFLDSPPSGKGGRPCCCQVGLEVQAPRVVSTGSVGREGRTACVTPAWWGGKPQLPMYPSVTTLAGVLGCLGTAQWKLKSRLPSKTLLAWVGIGQWFSVVLARVELRVCVYSAMSNSLPSHELQPTRLLCPWDSPGKNTGVGCHALLQGIFPGPGIEHTSPVSLALAGGFFTTKPLGKPRIVQIILKVFCFTRMTYSWFSVQAKQALVKGFFVLFLSVPVGICGLPTSSASSLGFLRQTTNQHRN